MTFKYDPFGRRIEKVSPAGTSIYAYDGDNLIEETDGSGNVVARYSQTQDVDEPLAMLRGGTTSFYEQDGLGSVTSLTNAAGALAETYTYDSFGKLTASAGSLTNPFQYTGRESDSQIGLYYYRARYYDSTTGRFLTEDPIGFNGGDNFYTYAHNSPILLDDPFGLKTEVIFWNPMNYFGSEWGHVSILINGVSYSWGPAPGQNPARECCRSGKMSIDQDPNGPKGYITQNRELRSGIGYILTLSPQQERKIVQSLEQYDDTGKAPNYNAITNNCLDPISRALAGAGVIQPRVFVFPNSFEDYLLNQPGLIKDWNPYPQIQTK